MIRHSIPVQIKLYIFKVIPTQSISERIVVIRLWCKHLIFFCPHHLPGRYGRLKSLLFIDIVCMRYPITYINKPSSMMPLVVHMWKWFTIEAVFLINSYHQKTQQNFSNGIICEARHVLRETEVQVQENPIYILCIHQ